MPDMVQGRFSCSSGIYYVEGMVVEDERLGLCKVEKVRGARSSDEAVVTFRRLHGPRSDHVDDAFRWNPLSQSWESLR